MKTVDHPMRILLIHQNFPGQFRHVAMAWATRPGWQVVALGRDTCPGLPQLNASPQFKLMRYKPHRDGHKDQHPYLRKMEDAVLHGQAVARELMKLKQQGFTPDVILAHPGWGETLYAKDVFPNARLIHLCEWYYNPHGADVNFDPEFPATLDDQLRIRTWNALHLLNLEHCDAAISPTHWQRAQHPSIYNPKIHVAHEGVDTEGLGPDAGAVFTHQLKNSVKKSATEDKAELSLKAGDPIITYVARNLEPYRGFHSFMRALEIVQREHPNVQTLVVGGDDVSYGKRPAQINPKNGSTATNWREHMLAQCRVDQSRTHFLGRIPYQQYKKVLQVSSAHVYLTVPFVLSWSLLEAMASGCLVIASNTAPVREVIQDGVNSLLVDFFNPQDIAQQLLHSLQEPRLSTPLRQAAQAHVQQRYGLQAGIGAYEQLLTPRTTSAASNSQPSNRHPGSPASLTRACTVRSHHNITSIAAPIQNKHEASAQSTRSRTEPTLPCRLPSGNCFRCCAISCPTNKFGMWLRRFQQEDE
jgi:glycosyltransferase involved in cell wall biosynthesis